MSLWRGQWHSWRSSENFLYVLININLVINVFVFLLANCYIETSFIYSHVKGDKKHTLQNLWDPVHTGKPHLRIKYVYPHKAHPNIHSKARIRIYLPKLEWIPYRQPIWTRKKNFKSFFRCNNYAVFLMEYEVKLITMGNSFWYS